MENDQAPGSSSLKSPQGHPHIHQRRPSPSSHLNVPRWAPENELPRVTEWIQTMPLPIGAFRDLTGALQKTESAPNITSQEQTERNPAESSEAGEECQICTERHNLNAFPQGMITPGCNHVVDICLACLEESIHVQMETKIWKDLACPLCPALLGYADMQAWAGKVDFER